MSYLCDTGFGRTDIGDGETHAVQTRIRLTLMEQLVGAYGWCPEHARAYVTRFLDGGDARDLVEHLIEIYELRGKRVLEIGSGLGNTLLELRRQDVDATGLEPGAEWLDIIRGRLAAEGYPTEAAVAGVGEALPFAHDSFDFVISLQVLEHVQDPEQVLFEIARVLRPGGLAYVAAPNYMSFAENHYRLFWIPCLPPALARKYLRWRGRDPSFYSEHINNINYLRMTRAFRRAGLVDMRVESLLRKCREPSHPPRARRLRRALLCLLGAGGGRAFRAAHLVRNVLRSEVTYLQGKPAR